MRAFEARAYDGNLLWLVREWQTACAVVFRDASPRLGLLINYLLIKVRVSSSTVAILVPAHSPKQKTREDSGTSTMSLQEKAVRVWVASWIPGKLTP